MRAEPNTNGQFILGFLSAFVLLAGVSLLLQTAAWFHKNQQPQAFVEFLNTPLLSILDIFTALIVILLLLVLVSAPAYMPRR